MYYIQLTFKVRELILSSINSHSNRRWATGLVVDSVVSYVVCFYQYPSAAVILLAHGYLDYSCLVNIEWISPLSTHS